ncbi:unnamed protein product [Porites lobata]|uniref:Reverse transcriptase domain-containing protein n=1 Tax=Porites lobata TaxID=104759 RepID=A0ABN8RUI1_9CNID|nr:unnamed protein product [Porites lobata]
MTKRLCTEYVDPRGLEAILANRLIPLDKGEGAVRPIGVGEVLRRIIGKCVTKVTKPDVIDASGSLQVCAGHKSGSEAAIHAMRELFEHDNSDAVLLIDASNAFNSLNRAAALHNIRVLCPSIATYAINTYREPARLFINSARHSPFLEPLERAIADLLVPAITEHVTTQEERDLLELPVCLGGLGLVNPARTASQEYEASVKITGPLVRQIVKQAHEPPDETEIKTLQASARREKDELLKMQCEQVRESLPSKTKRAVELATEKGASNWLTVIPIKEMNFNLNKREFRDAIKLRYDWEIADLPAMHNEIRDLEAEMLRTVCTDVETEPVLQEITGEELNRGANKAPDARLDVHARGFWDKQQSAFFDVRVCHPNADSYRELSPKQIFQLHENEKKRQYSRRVLEVEQGTFTPLVFTSTGGMADECKRFHSRLAELLALKKGDDYATTISWIRAKVSFAILRSALLCLRGTRSKRRAANISDIDITSESAQARI